MSKLYDKINDDLKQAMIGKDHKRVSVLKMLKSAILYSVIDSGARDQISDEQVVVILQKESKKRREAYELYAKAGDKHREEEEKYEKETIDQYLPEMLSEDQVAELVDKAIERLETVNPQMLGKIIAEVKSESKGLAEGSLIARLTKERISK
jgi:hypothetical protein